MLAERTVRTPRSDERSASFAGWTVPASLDADCELLLRSVRAVVTGVRDPQAAGLADGATSRWARIATDNKLGVLALQGLGPDAGRLPGEARELLELSRAQTIRRNTAGLLTLRRVLPLFEQAGVPALAFKGPVSQLATYGSYFSKPATDVDLLVSASDFERAQAVLVRDGYELPPVCDTPWWRRFLGEQPLLHADPSLAPIDLHHKLQQPGCPSPRRLHRFLAEREMLPVAGTPTPTLSPRHAALHACMSLAKGLVNRDPSGGHAADIAARLRTCGPAALASLLAEAREQKLENTLALGLQAARALFGVAVDARVADAPLGLDGAELARAVLVPTDPAAVWPRRRELLRGSCDDYPSFVGELALTVASELCRRAYEPRASTADVEAVR